MSQRAKDGEKSHDDPTLDDGLEALGVSEAARTIITGLLYHFRGEFEDDPDKLEEMDELERAIIKQAFLLGQ